MSFEYAAYLALILTGTLALQRAFRIQLPARRLVVAVLPVAAFFIAWDVLAVDAGHWSFNPDFLLGLLIGNQPVEEIAFFIVVPTFYVVAWEIAKRQSAMLAASGKKTRGRQA